MSALILASTSAVRARLLREAGLDFSVVPSQVDEEIVKKSKPCSGTGTLALSLAKAKAKAVATRYSDVHVIGADQILECDGRRFDKPVDLAAARAQLLVLKGKTHGLVTACTVFQGEACLFEHVSTPKLTMRAFSEAFLDDYLAKMGDSVTSSVGAYQLERMGAQLFEAIDGDYFTILGLPLLPLLSFLRAEGLVRA